jgi:Spy/CpxP family protein refolding chaperone
MPPPDIRRLHAGAEIKALRGDFLAAGRCHIGRPLTSDKDTNMKLTYKIIAGIAAAMSLAVAATVSAHPGGGFGYGGVTMGPRMGMGMGMGMGSRMGGPLGGSDMSAAASAHAAQLKADLKIMPAQEAAWKAYEAAIVQQAVAMQTARGKMLELMQKSQPGSAEFIVQRDVMIKQHDAGFAARTAALKDLYAVLTPEQRAVADGDIGPMGGYRLGHWHPMR